MTCAAYVSRKEWRASSIALVIGLGLIDTTAVPFPMFGTGMRSGVDDRIRSSGTGIVVELPFGARDGLDTIGRFDHRALVHQTAHQQPSAGGAVARLPTKVKHEYAEQPTFAALMSWPIGELPENLASDLRTMGVRYVVVNTDVMTGDVGLVLRKRKLRLLMTDGARELYAVD